MRALVEQPQTPMTGVDVAAKTALSGGAQANV
jgi:hypothetical protein